MDWKDVVAGGVGGGLSVLCAHPFDTIKVRLQTTNNYSGMRDCFMKMVRKEGARSLFKGMSFPICSVALINCMSFGAYSTTLRTVAIDSANPRPPELIVAGCSAGIAVCCLSPVELIKIRLQCITGQRMISPLSMTKQIYQHGKIFSSMGLYRGLGAQLARDSIGYSLYFLPYVYGCKFLEDNDILSGSAAIVAAGSLAGLLTWLVTNPVDVVKTQYQTNASEISTRNVTQKLYRLEGITGFSRGILANSVRGIPQSGALFLGYETTLKLLKDYDC